VFSGVMSRASLNPMSDWVDARNILGKIQRAM
jgi:hypothetical protein